eukprot:TRINITY_DN742_c2_g1_i11.p1 TRINITY_DN742_c2_g1~~TRINITY_DN742_c2_g1_i11.p1  ORF type:complete len:4418 (+),score=1172.62 TRINITY_DN742_c2_g1_i11:965-13255(+)
MPDGVSGVRHISFGAYSAATPGLDITHLAFRFYEEGYPSRYYGSEGSDQLEASDIITLRFDDIAVLMPGVNNGYDLYQRYGIEVFVTGVPGAAGNVKFNTNRGDGSLWVNSLQVAPGYVVFVWPIKSIRFMFAAGPTVPTITVTFYYDDAVTKTVSPTFVACTSGTYWCASVHEVVTADYMKWDTGGFFVDFAYSFTHSDSLPGRITHDFVNNPPATLSAGYFAERELYQYDLTIPGLENPINSDTWDANPGVLVQYSTTMNMRYPATKVLLVLSSPQSGCGVQITLANGGTVQDNQTVTATEPCGSGYFCNTYVVTDVTFDSLTFDAVATSCMHITEVGYVFTDIDMQPTATIPQGVFTCHLHAVTDATIADDIANCRLDGVTPAPTVDASSSQWQVSSSTSFYFASSLSATGLLMKFRFRTLAQGHDVLVEHMHKDATTTRTYVRMVPCVADYCGTFVRDSGSPITNITVSTAAGTFYITKIAVSFNGAVTPTGIVAASHSKPASIPGMQYSYIGLELNSSSYKINAVNRWLIQGSQATLAFDYPVKSVRFIMYTPNEGDLFAVVREPSGKATTVWWSPCDSLTYCGEYAATYDTGVSYLEISLIDSGLPYLVYVSPVYFSFDGTDATDLGYQLLTFANETVPEPIMRFSYPLFEEETHGVVYEDGYFGPGIDVSSRIGQQSFADGQRAETAVFLLTMPSLDPLVNGTPKVTCGDFGLMDLAVDHEFSTWYGCGSRYCSVVEVKAAFTSFEFSTGTANPYLELMAASFAGTQEADYYEVTFDDAVGTFGPADYIKQFFFTDSSPVVATNYDGTQGLRVLAGNTANLYFMSRKANVSLVVSSTGAASVNVALMYQTNVDHVVSADIQQDCGGGYKCTWLSFELVDQLSITASGADVIVDDVQYSFSQSDTGYGVVSPDVSGLALGTNAPTSLAPYGIFFFTPSEIGTSPTNTKAWSISSDASLLFAGRSVHRVLLTLSSPTGFEADLMSSTALITKVSCSMRCESSPGSPYCVTVEQTLADPDAALYLNFTSGGSAFVEVLKYTFYADSPLYEGATTVDFSTVATGFGDYAFQPLLLRSFISSAPHTVVTSPVDGSNAYQLAAGAELNMRFNFMKVTNFRMLVHSTSVPQEVELTYKRSDKVVYTEKLAFIVGHETQVVAMDGFDEVTVTTTGTVLVDDVQYSFDGTSVFPTGAQVLQFEETDFSSDAFASKYVSYIGPTTVAPYDADFGSRALLVTAGQELDIQFQNTLVTGLAVTVQLFISANSDASIQAQGVARGVATTLQANQQLVVPCGTSGGQCVTYKSSAIDQFKLKNLAHDMYVYDITYTFDGTRKGGAQIPYPGAYSVLSSDIGDALAATQRYLYENAFSSMHLTTITPFLETKTGFLGDAAILVSGKDVTLTFAMPLTAFNIIVYAFFSEPFYFNFACGLKTTGTFVSYAMEFICGNETLAQDYCRSLAFEETCDTLTFKYDVNDYMVHVARYSFDGSEPVPGHYYVDFSDITTTTLHSNQLFAILHATQSSVEPVYGTALIQQSGVMKVSAMVMKWEYWRMLIIVYPGTNTVNITEYDAHVAIRKDSIDMTPSNSDVFVCGAGDFFYCYIHYRSSLDSPCGNAFEVTAIGAFLIDDLAFTYDKTEDLKGFVSSGITITFEEGSGSFALSDYSWAHVSELPSTTLVRGYDGSYWLQCNVTCVFKFEFHVVNRFLVTVSADTAFALGLSGSLYGKEIITKEYQVGASCLGSTDVCITLVVSNFDKLTLTVPSIALVDNLRYSFDEALTPYPTGAFLLDFESDFGSTDYATSHFASHIGHAVGSSESVAPTYTGHGWVLQDGAESTIIFSYLTVTNFCAMLVANVSGTSVNVQVLAAGEASYTTVDVNASYAPGYYYGQLCAENFDTLKLTPGAAGVVVSNMRYSFDSSPVYPVGIQKPDLALMVNASQYTSLGITFLDPAAVSSNAPDGDGWDVSSVAQRAVLFNMMPVTYMRCSIAAISADNLVVSLYRGGVLQRTVTVSVDAACGSYFCAEFTTNGTFDYTTFNAASNMVINRLWYSFDSMSPFGLIVSDFGALHASVITADVFRNDYISYIGTALDLTEHLPFMAWDINGLNTIQFSSMAVTDLKVDIGFNDTSGPLAAVVTTYFRAQLVDQYNFTDFAMCGVNIRAAGDLCTSAYLTGAAPFDEVTVQGGSYILSIAHSVDSTSVVPTGVVALDWHTYPDPSTMGHRLVYSWDGDTIADPHYGAAYLLCLTCRTFKVVSRFLKWQSFSLTVKGGGSLQLVISLVSNLTVVETVNYVLKHNEYYYCDNGIPCYTAAYNGGALFDTIELSVASYTGSMREAAPLASSSLNLVKLLMTFDNTSFYAASGMQVVTFEDVVAGSFSTASYLDKGVTFGKETTTTTSFRSSNGWVVNDTTSTISFVLETYNSTDLTPVVAQGARFTLASAVAGPVQVTAFSGGSANTSSIPVNTPCSTLSPMWCGTYVTTQMYEGFNITTPTEVIVDDVKFSFDTSFQGPEGAFVLTFSGSTFQYDAYIDTHYIDALGEGTQPLSDCFLGKAWQVPAGSTEAMSFSYIGTSTVLLLICTTVPGSNVSILTFSAGVSGEPYTLLYTMEYHVGYYCTSETFSSLDRLELTPQGGAALVGRVIHTLDGSYMYPVGRQALDFSTLSGSFDSNAFKSQMVSLTGDTTATSNTYDGSNAWAWLATHTYGVSFSFITITSQMRMVFTGGVTATISIVAYQNNNQVGTFTVAVDTPCGDSGALFCGELTERMVADYVTFTSTSDTALHTFWWAYDNSVVVPSGSYEATISLVVLAEQPYATLSPSPLNERPGYDGNPAWTLAPGMSYFVTFDLPATSVLVTFSLETASSLETVDITAVKWEYGVPQSVPVEYNCSALYYCTTYFKEGVESLNITPGASTMDVTSIKYSFDSTIVLPTGPFSMEWTSAFGTFGPTDFQSVYIFEVGPTVHDLSGFEGTNPMKVTDTGVDVDILTYFLPMSDLRILMSADVDETCAALVLQASNDTTNSVQYLNLETSVPCGGFMCQTATLQNVSHLRISSDATHYPTALCPATSYTFSVMLEKVIFTFDGSTVLPQGVSWVRFASVPASFASDEFSNQHILQITGTRDVAPGPDGSTVWSKVVGTASSDVTFGILTNNYVTPHRMPVMRARLTVMKFTPLTVPLTFALNQNYESSSTVTISELYPCSTYYCGTVLASASTFDTVVIPAEIDLVDDIMFSFDDSLQLPVGIIGPVVTGTTGKTIKYWKYKEDYIDVIGNNLVVGSAYDTSQCLEVTAGNSFSLNFSYIKATAILVVCSQSGSVDVNVTTDLTTSSITALSAAYPPGYYCASLTVNGVLYIALEDVTKGGLLVSGLSYSFDGTLLLPSGLQHPDFTPYPTSFSPTAFLNHKVSFTTYQTATAYDGSTGWSVGTPAYMIFSYFPVQGTEVTFTAQITSSKVTTLTVSMLLQGVSTNLVVEVNHPCGVSQYCAALATWQSFDALYFQPTDAVVVSHIYFSYYADELLGFSSYRTATNFPTNITSDMFNEDSMSFITPGVAGLNYEGVNGLEVGAAGSALMQFSPQGVPLQLTNFAAWCSADTGGTAYTFNYVLRSKGTVIESGPVAMQFACPLNTSHVCTTFQLSGKMFDEIEFYGNGHDVVVYIVTYSMDGTSVIPSTLSEQFDVTIANTQFLSFTTGNMQDNGENSAMSVPEDNTLQITFFEAKLFSIVIKSPVMTRITLTLMRLNSTIGTEYVYPTRECSDKFCATWTGSGFDTLIFQKPAWLPTYYLDDLWLSLDGTQIVPQGSQAATFDGVSSPMPSGYYESIGMVIPTRTIIIANDAMLIGASSSRTVQFSFLTNSAQVMCFASAATTVSYVVEYRGTRLQNQVVANLESCDLLGAGFCLGIIAYDFDTITISTSASDLYVDSINFSFSDTMDVRGVWDVLLNNITTVLDPTAPLLNYSTTYIGEYSILQAFVPSVRAWVLPTAIFTYGFSMYAATKVSILFSATTNDTVVWLDVHKHGDIASQACNVTTPCGDSSFCSRVVLEDTTGVDIRPASGDAHLVEIKYSFDGTQLVPEGVFEIPFVAVGWASSDFYDSHHIDYIGPTR